ncbi:hypothetical protein AB0C07_31345 [Actinoplanes missouriensis]|uniref:hypothetical protein n=1 Tax=Actinoplanes missouriensis TaxID=1866 RepID=UPI0033CDECBD
MNKVKRMLALSSMGLAAGAMLGAAPAQAEPAAPSNVTSSSASAGPRWDNDYVVGYYRWERACYRAGFTGQRYGAWWRFHCEPVWLRGWRGWVLEVKGSHWRWDEWRGGWPKGWDDRPDRFGKPFSIRNGGGPGGNDFRGGDNVRGGDDFRGGDNFRGGNQGGPGGDDFRGGMGGQGGDDFRGGGQGGPGGDDFRGGMGGQGGPGGDDFRGGKGGDDFRGGKGGDDDRGGKGGKGGDDDRGGKGGKGGKGGE